jgi:hypothetical protein
MKFSVHGPFEIPRVGQAIELGARDRRQFWQAVDEAEPGLSEACGCYVFIIRNKAHYVGLAQRQPFKNECFGPHKIVAYNQALRSVTGPPYFVLCARRTGGGRLSSPSRNGHRDVDFLEKLLIGQAIQRNPNLQNIHGTKLLQQLHVPGVVNSRPGEANAHSVKVLRKALGI